MTEPITPNELDLLQKSLVVIYRAHEKLNPCVAEDNHNQLDRVLQQQFERNHAVLRHLMAQLNDFGADLYLPTKVEREEREEIKCRIAE